jgi:hypothetical protein
MKDRKTDIKDMNPPSARINFFDYLSFLRVIEQDFKITYLTLFNFTKPNLAKPNLT